MKGLLLALPVALIGGAVMGMAWPVAAPRGTRDDDAPNADRQVDGPSSPSAIYVSHCQVCHGAQGDGRGPAARYLFPKPRDFGRQQFRLVTTANRVASDEDIAEVIRRGMPGTGMRAFASFSAAELQTLVDDVKRFRRQGVTRRLREQSFEDEVPAEPSAAAVDRFSVAGPRLPAPDLSGDDPAAVARGRDLYVKYGCHQCHGADGRGLYDQDHRDQLGEPLWARDLVFEPMKGGAGAESVYYRIRLGVPPVMGQVSDERHAADLTRFVLSLSRQPKLRLTNHQRAARAAGVRVREP